MSISSNSSSNAQIVVENNQNNIFDKAFEATYEDFENMAKSYKQFKRNDGIQLESQDSGNEGKLSMFIAPSQIKCTSYELFRSQTNKDDNNKIRLQFLKAIASKFNVSVKELYERASNEFKEVLKLRKNGFDFFNDFDLDDNYSSVKSGKPLTAYRINKVIEFIKGENNLWARNSQPQNGNNIQSDNNIVKDPNENIENKIPDNGNNITRNNDKKAELSNNKCKIYQKKIQEKIDNLNRIAANTMIVTDFSTRVNTDEQQPRKYTSFFEKLFFSDENPKNDENNDNAKKNEIDKDNIEVAPMPPTQENINDINDLSQIQYEDEGSNFLSGVNFGINSRAPSMPQSRRMSREPTRKLQFVINIASAYNSTLTVETDNNDNNQTIKEGASKRERDKRTNNNNNNIHTIVEDDNEDRFDEYNNETNNRDIICTNSGGEKNSSSSEEKKSKEKLNFDFCSEIIDITSDDDHPSPQKNGRMRSAKELAACTSEYTNEVNKAENNKKNTSITSKIIDKINKMDIEFTKKQIEDYFTESLDIKIQEGDTYPFEKNALLSINELIRCFFGEMTEKKINEKYNALKTMGLKCNGSPNIKVFDDYKIQKFFEDDCYDFIGKETEANIRKIKNNNKKPFLFIPDKSYVEKLMDIYLDKLKPILNWMKNVNKDKNIHKNYYSKVNETFANIIKAIIQKRNEVFSCRKDVEDFLEKTQSGYDFYNYLYIDVFSEKDVLLNLRKFELFCKKFGNDKNLIELALDMAYVNEKNSRPKKDNVCAKEASATYPNHSVLIAKLTNLLKLKDHLTELENNQTSKDSNEKKINININKENENEKNEDDDEKINKNINKENEKEINKENDNKIIKVNEKDENENEEINTNKKEENEKKDIEQNAIETNSKKKNERILGELDSNSDRIQEKEIGGSKYEDHTINTGSSKFTYKKSFLDNLNKRLETYHKFINKFTNLDYEKTEKGIIKAIQDEKETDLSEFEKSLSEDEIAYFRDLGLEYKEIN